MATFHDKIVEVTLVYGAANIETAQFDIPLVLAGHNVTGNIVEVYTSPDAMIQAGFSLTDSAYVMANLLFQGEFAPSEVIVGKRDITNQTITPTVTNGGVYSITLKSGNTSKKFTFTADSTATAAEIVEGLKTEIEADSVWAAKATITTTATGVVITPVVGSYLSFSVTSNMVISTTFANDIITDLTAVADENNTWFWIVTDSHVDADVMAVAGYAESHDKIYWFSSQDPDIVNNVDGNLLQTVGNTGYNNTGFALWSSTADTTFPEASVVGSICSVTPGLTTLHGKTLTGTTLEKLPTTQEVNIVTQNGNIYRKEHGVLFYRDGRMVSGDFCDYIAHALWVKARVEESIFSLFKSQSRLGSGVRFTTNGLDQIYQAIWANPINVGILNGSIANEVVTDEEAGMKVDLKPVIFIPSRANIPTSDITERMLDGVVVEYVYAGFIHYVKVKVNVLVNRTATSTAS